MDFSAIALRIKSIGDREAIAALDQIDRKAQATAKQVNDIFDNTLYKGSLRDAERDYDRLVNAWKNGSDQAAAAVQNVSTKVDQMSRRSGTGAMMAARGFEMMARTGQEAGRSLDTILASVSQLAFGFGAEGALVAAAAIGTSAIVELFTRTQRELEKTQQIADETYAHLANSHSLRSDDERLRQLYSGFVHGTSASENPYGEYGEMGIRQLTQYVAQLRSQLAAIPQVSDAEKALMAASGGQDIKDSQSARRADLRNQLDAALSALVQMRTEHTRIEGLERQELQTEVDRVTAGIKLAAQKHEEHNALKGLIATEDERLRLITEQHKAKDLTVSFIGEREMPVLQQLRDRQDGINLLLGIGNISLEERLKLERNLRDVEKEIADQEDRIDKALLKTIHVAKSEKRERAPSVSVQQALEDLQSAREALRHGINGAQADFVNAIDELQRAITKKLDGDLKNAVEEGFKRAFDGEGLQGFFKGFGEVLLSSLGDVFVQLGESLMSFGAIADAIATAITALGIYAGPAAMAAGAALIALGVGMKAGASSLSHASSHGGYGGGSGYGGSSTVVTYGIVNPVSSRTAAAVPTQPRPSVTNHNYIIGPADPVAQRAWDELQRRSLQRGSIRGA